MYGLRQLKIRGACPEPLWTVTLLGGQAPWGG